MQHPIGVFDSGVGGLTVLRALRKRLPSHDFLYLGDTARVPYGRKPREMVKTFAQQIAHFLVDRGAEAIVIACNTASASALPELQDELPVPLWGVIEPGVAAARAATKTGRVGVIGTRGTIDSGAYQRRLVAAGLEVWAQACPMLVHVVEEGLADSPEAEVLVRHYLRDRPAIDSLILGCTHYPVLRDTIQRVAGPEVTLVESADAIAESLYREIGDCPTERPGSVLHYVTGDPLAYRHTAQVIDGLDGEIVALDVNSLAR